MYSDLDVFLFFRTSQACVFYYVSKQALIKICYGLK